MRVKRKIVEIDDELCDGCGQCILSCAEGAIEVRDGKARLVEERYCDGLGACLGECPKGALIIVEREVDDFDEAAVEAYLKEKAEEPAEPALQFACPAAQIQTFSPEASADVTKENRPQAETRSSLSHWPVQIHLVPPTAAFLKGADLLVAADCTPIAYPNFHHDFLKGKVVMIGCPKFDNIPEYVQKFTDIFNNADIKSITTLIMEVPCCSGLPMIVKKAMEAAGKDIPLEEVVIGARGEILN